MAKSTRRTYGKTASAAITAIGLAASFSLAQSTTFNKPGGGNWSDPTAWTPAGPPASGDAILLPFSSPPGPNPIVVINYDLPTIATLDEIGTWGTPSELTLNIPQGGIAANNIHIGALESQGGLTTFNLGNAVLIAQQNLILGANVAGGTLNQSAGTLSAGTMHIGLSGRNGPQIPSGYTLSGGVATVGTLNLGSAQTEGTLNISGGMLTVNNVANLGTTTDVRGGETSYVNHTGGSMVVHGSEFLGDDNSSVHMTISGTAQHLVDGLLHIARGPAGSGQFFSAGNTASLRVLGGMLSAGSIELGDATFNGPPFLTGTFEVAGGVTTTSLLRLGRANTSTMTSGVSGGVLNVNGPIIVQDRATFTVSGGTVEAERLTIDSGLATHGTMTLSGGDVRLTGPTASLLRDGNFTIAGMIDAWIGRLDGDRSPIVFEHGGTSPITTIANQIKSGFANGAWTGNGIRSSAAAGDSRTAIGYAQASDIGSPTTWFGQSTDPTAVLMRYTLFGDANLDATVNIGDFSNLAANFNQPGFWFDGDFNYDGTVNLGDFALLAGNFNQTLALSRSTVPEPVGFAVLLMCLRAVRRQKNAT